MEQPKTDNEIRDGLRQIDNVAEFCRRYSLSRRTVYVLLQESRPIRPGTRNSLTYALNAEAKRIEPQAA